MDGTNRCPDALFIAVAGNTESRISSLTPTPQRELEFDPNAPTRSTRRLQRRQYVGGEERSTPWDPADSGKLGRLMELISFHELAGSSRYTGLYNRYLSELDCSDLIRLDRAILICELKDPTLSWSLRRNAIPIQAAEGQRKTLLRLIIPVSQNKNASPASSSVNPPIDPKP